jgi:hypothetical protein
VTYIDGPFGVSGAMARMLNNIKKAEASAPKSEPEQEKFVKVRFVKERFIVDRTYAPGETPDLPVEAGKRVIAGGFAIPYREDERATITPKLEDPESKMKRRK